MNYQHKSLASGRWSKFSFVEQMANIGSEVERALNWRTKNNADYSQRALERAFELIDLTLKDVKSSARIKELTLLKESLEDYFLGTNQFMSTEASWRKYFYCFTYAARKNY